MASLAAVIGAWSWWQVRQQTAGKSPLVDVFETGRAREPRKMQGTLLAEKEGQIMVNTLVHDKKVRARKQAAERESNRQAAIYRNACKALKRNPRVGAEDMSYEQRAELLRDYVDVLEGHIAEFDALYADTGGRSACVVIRRERSYALSELASLLVSISRGDEPLRVPK